MWHRQNTPSRTCLVFDDVRYSYDDVSRQANRVAHHLACIGITAGDTVALIAERTPDLIWSILALAQMGAIFVVIDSSYPKARIEQLLGIACPKAILLCGNAELSDMVAPLDYACMATVHTALLPADSSGDPFPVTVIAPAIDPKAAAYYLFTSGSTGQPKCVANNHQPLVNFIGWHIETAGLTREDRFTLLSGLSHDPLLRDIFTPLSLGATLLIPRQITITEPGRLSAWMHKTGATIAHLTPGLGHLIAAGGVKATALPRMRHFFWGGDQLPVPLLNRIGALAVRARHTNFYGCTETPQAVAWFPCPRSLSDGQTIPVGMGSRGFDILVVNSDKTEISDGTPGEIAVRSSFLSMGYVRDGVILPPDDRGTEIRRRVYYTGDRGYRRPDGMVVATGRADDQIKLRGHRIDLSEITAVLLQHPDVRNAAALAAGEGDQKHIAAFVVPSDSATFHAEDLRQYCIEHLPAYMMPNSFQLMAEGLPLLPNGKLDRQRLAEEYRKPVATQSAQVRPKSSSRPEGRSFSKTSQRLSDLQAAWQSIFPGQTMDAGASFVSLGGDSLSYVDAYLAAEEIVGTLPVGWQKLSLARIAEQTPAKSGMVAEVDSAMLIRAVAICLVETQHAGLPPHVSPTHSLMLVSGFLFGQLNWRHMFSDENKLRMLRPLRSILPPVLLFCYAPVLADLIVRSRHPQLSAPLFLSADLASFRPGSTTPSYLLYWYVHDLIKLILMSFAIQVAAIRLFPRLQKKLLFVAACAFAFALLRFTLPLFFLSDVHNMGQKGVLVFESNPLANLSLFYLGILCSQLKTLRRRLTMLAAGIPFFILDSYYFERYGGLFLFLAMTSLLFIPRFPVIRGVERLIYVVSGASLYIYLGEVWLWHIVEAAKGPLHIPAELVPLCRVMVCVTGGVLLSSLAKQTGRIWRHVKTWGRQLERAFFRSLSSASRTAI